LAFDGEGIGEGAKVGQNKGEIIDPRDATSGSSIVRGYMSAIHKINDAKGRSERARVLAGAEIGFIRGLT
jgi:hypothetical protein